MYQEPWSPSIAPSSGTSSMTSSLWEPFGIQYSLPEPSLPEHSLIPVQQNVRGAQRRPHSNSIVRPQSILLRKKSAGIRIFPEKIQVKRWNFGTPVWLNVMFSAGCFCTGRAAFASKSSLHLPTWWWNFTANVLAGQKWKRMSELMGIPRLRDTGFILHNRPVGVCGTKAFHSPPRASLGLTSAFGWSSGNDTKLKQLFVSICYVERRSFKGLEAATT